MTELLHLRYVSKISWH